MSAPVDYPTLYSLTGDVKDINTLLVPASQLEAIGAGGVSAPGAKGGSAVCCNTDCPWGGKLTECVMCGTVGPLCPECREVVEPAEQLSELPKGWKPVLVNSEFDNLMIALARAQDKGYMPDTMLEEWMAFEYRAVPTTPKDAE